MRILLIDPPFERFQGIRRGFFPLGAASVGAALSRAGHQVRIYDGEQDNDSRVISYAGAQRVYQLYLDGLKNREHPVWREIRGIISEESPDLLGISCLTVKFDSAVIIAEMAREIFPELPVVFGGIHPTLLPAQVLARKEVNFVIRGEGEETFQELALALEQKKGFAAIPGLSYKKEDRVIHNPDRPHIGKLDELPFPGRHLLSNDRQYHHEDLGLIMGSRGCPFACTYCASNKVWTRKVRYRSAENIVREIEKVHRQYGTSQFSLEDDSFTVNRKLVHKFCDQLDKRGLKIKWSAITRINLLTEEIIDRMRRSGLNHLRVGIESGSDRILQYTRKGLTVEDIRKGARVIRKSGIYWSAYFMLGLPAETVEDIRKTVRLMEEIKPDYCTLSIFTPYPGTVIFDELLAQGKVSGDMDWSRFSHGSPYNHFSEKIEDFQDIAGYAASAVDRYNGNFFRIFRRARSKASIYLASPGEFTQDVKRYLSWRFTRVEKSR